MDDAAKRKAERVAHFYYAGNDPFGEMLHPSGEATVTRYVDDATWGRVILTLGGEDRTWLLGLYDEVRDLATALWRPEFPATAPIDVATGEVDTEWTEAAEAKAAAVAATWDSDRWDAVERRVEDDGSARQWFHALADAVRELHEALVAAQ